MQFSEQWLRSVVDPALDADALAERLTMAGLEVESCAPVAPAFGNVVVGHVLAVERHPNADRLTVCQVDVGADAPLSIVCGAPNVAPGIRVPCARAGAELPGGLRIKATTMRGVASEGMLCSARELGMSDDHSGLLLLPPDAAVGRDVRDVLALDDHLLTIKLTPNRGDCLSIIGIAREVAALTGAVPRWPSLLPVTASLNERLSVKIEAPDLCGRFSGRIVRGLNARAATPAWMQQRLERSGQRSISALVDISNYVMLELGRPSHVFDLDKVQGALTVRWGKPGEQVELLNGQTVTVDERVGVITDGRGIEALAGVMGGEATAVSLDTTNVYLEAAFWWPAAIQGRARRFGFSTDAAHRFERGVDFATTADHLEYLTRLILEICGTPQTQVGPVDDQIIALPERPPVRMRTARCRKVIGLPLSDAEMQAPLARLGLAPRELDGAIEITPPSYRFDLEREEDLIEEVARIHGFDSIVARPPLARAGMRAQPEERRRPHDLRRLLATLGYQEVVTYSFVDEQLERDFGTGEPIRLLNPIASQMSVMRTTLLGSLVAVLRHNLNHRAARVRVFELARVFARAPDVVDAPLAVAGVRQPLRVAALAYGPLHDEGWNSETRLADFFDIKGDAEQVLGKLPVRFVPAVHPALHPGRSARIERLTGEAIGWVGELHPRLQQAHELPRAPVAFELDVEALLALDLPRFAPISRVPSIQRDLALWFPEQVTYQAVMQEISHLVETERRLQHVRDFRLFDLFRPPVGDSSKVAEAGANVLFTKEKSLAFRVVLQDTERTLNEIEADAAVEALVAGLASRFGARLRS